MSSVWGFTKQGDGGGRSEKGEKKGEKLAPTPSSRLWLPFPASGAELSLIKSGIVTNTVSH